MQFNTFRSASIQYANYFIERTHTNTNTHNNKRKNGENIWASLNFDNIWNFHNNQNKIKTKDECEISNNSNPYTNG